MGGADGQDLIQREEHGTAGAKLIEGAHLDQAFQRALTHLAQVHPAGKIIDIGEWMVSARFQDRIHRSMPDILDRTQPEADGILAVREVSMVKSQPVVFTQGGWTSMPIRRQSATYSATLSVSFWVTESRAVMYSSG